MKRNDEPGNSEGIFSYAELFFPMRCFFFQLHFYVISVIETEKSEGTKTEVLDHNNCFLVYIHARARDIFDYFSTILVSEKVVSIGDSIEFMGRTKVEEEKPTV